MDVQYIKPKYFADTIDTVDQYTATIRNQSATVVIATLITIDIGHTTAQTAMVITTATTVITEDTDLIATVDTVEDVTIVEVEYVLPTDDNLYIIHNYLFNGGYISLRFTFSDSHLRNSRLFLY